jgi:hypothetical protein
MQNKGLVSVIVVLLLVIIGGSFWLLFGKKEAALPMAVTSSSGISGQSGEALVNAKDDGTLATDSVVAVDASRSASLDEITTSMHDDLTSDSMAMTEEETAETGNVNEGASAIQDLGQSYDESKY